MEMNYFVALLTFFVFLTRFVPFEVTGREQEPILTAYEKRQGTVNREHLGVQYLAQQYLSGRQGLLFRINFREFRSSRVFVTAGSLGLNVSNSVLEGHGPAGFSVLPG